MNERAAAVSSFATLGHIEEQRSVFAGPFGYNAPHSHSVPVLIAGLYGSFCIRLTGQAWTPAQGAVVEAGTSYERDVGGEAICVLYLEPEVGGVKLLQPLVAHAEGSSRALLGKCRVHRLLRELYEDGHAAGWHGEALDDIIRIPDHSPGTALDPRIERAVSLLQQGTRPAAAAQTAAAVGLSSSRFQHLFAAEVATHRYPHCGRGKQSDDGGARRRVCQSSAFFACLPAYVRGSALGEPVMGSRLRAALIDLYLPAYMLP